MTEDERKESARKAAEARWAKKPTSRLSTPVDSLVEKTLDRPL